MEIEKQQFRKLLTTMVRSNHNENGHEDESCQHHLLTSFSVLKINKASPDYSCQEIKTREMAPITTKIMIAAMIMAIVYPMDFSFGDFMRIGNPI